MAGSLDVITTIYIRSQTASSLHANPTVHVKRAVSLKNTPSNTVTGYVSARIYSARSLSKTIFAESTHFCTLVQSSTGVSGQNNNISSDLDFNVAADSQRPRLPIRGQDQRHVLRWIRGRAKDGRRVVRCAAGVFL